MEVPDKWGPVDWGYTVLSYYACWNLFYVYVFCCICTAKTTRCSKGASTGDHRWVEEVQRQEKTQRSNPHNHVGDTIQSKSIQNPGKHVVIVVVVTIKTDVDLIEHMCWWYSGIVINFCTSEWVKVGVVVWWLPYMYLMTHSHTHCHVWS